MTDAEKTKICGECRAYGDDYYQDDNGEMVCACDECWVNEEVNDV